jgi:ribosomal protein L44E
MAEHFSRNTIFISAWCRKCSKNTPHRVEDRRKGPCLDCIARLDVEHAQREIDARRAARQCSLFSERVA